MDTDIELARHLGVSASTIASWRTRNSIPFKECARVASETTSPLDWLVLGEESPRHIQRSESGIDAQLLAVVIRERRFETPDRFPSHTWKDDEARATRLIDEYLRHLSLMNKAVSSGMATREQFIEMIRGAAHPGRKR